MIEGAEAPVVAQEAKSDVIRVKAKKKAVMAEAASEGERPSQQQP